MLRKLEGRDQLHTAAGVRVAMVLGSVTLLCAALGIACSVSLLAFVGNGATAAASSPSLLHFYPAFFAMWAICVTCHLALAWGAYLLIRQRAMATRLLVGVWLFELAYVFTVGVMWRVPGIGPSIAGATGIANGGLMVQFVILLPFWGPLVLLWIHRRQLRRIRSLPSTGIVG